MDVCVCARVPLVVCMSKFCSSRITGISTA